MGEKIVISILVVGLVISVFFVLHNRSVQLSHPEGRSYGTWTDGAGW